MSIEDLIPGLREAQAWEASVRSRAFLDVPYSLCGVEVLPLSLHRLRLLEEARNPFVCGGTVTDAAVAVFLWVLSPTFRARDLDARAEFLAPLIVSRALADLEACAREIEEFLDEMFLDAPGGGGQASGPAITSSEAVYCELFGEACGWTDAQTLHMPLPRLYQILRRITLRDDPDAIFENRRSDKVRGDYQRALQLSSQVSEDGDHHKDGDCQEHQQKESPTSGE